MAQQELDPTEPPLLHLVPDLAVEPCDVTDVYPVLSGGWRATCDCGATSATASSSDGWDWVLSHPCDRGGGGPDGGTNG
jgi:hypothetical protein